MAAEGRSFRHWGRNQRGAPGCLRERRNVKGDKLMVISKNTAKTAAKVLRDLMKSGETDVSPKQMEDALDELDDGFTQMALDALKEERT